jgi:hypothetical protein
MTKKPRLKGNFISEWFGQRIYPEVRLDHGAISGSNAGMCPFLSSIKREKTACIKPENAFGVCTINSPSGGERRDWLVCPYRVIDSAIVSHGCETVFGVSDAVQPLPISILSSKKGAAAFESVLDELGSAFVFFQDKLGGEISISGTSASPEVAFDVTVVELTKVGSGAVRVGRYGFIEIQTMDYHGTYKHAVKNLSDAHRLHGKKFASELAQNEVWMSDRIEGPNIANVFKRTFYQTLLKFELSKKGAAAGTVLALPEAVWDSWQPFLGRPPIEAVTDTEFRMVGSDNEAYHGTNAWIFVFRLDTESDSAVSPVRVVARLRVSVTDLVQHAFVTVPKNMMVWATGENMLLGRIRDRIKRAVPAILVE